MKRKLMSLIALVLASAFIFSCVIVSAQGETVGVNAADDPAAQTLLSEMKANKSANGCCDYDPVIILPGINHSEAYWADENGNPKTNSKGEVISGTTVIIDKETLIPFAIKKIAVPLIKTIITQRDCGLSQAFREISAEAFKIQSADKEGNTYENIQLYHYGSLASVDQETYDWMLRMVSMQGLIDVVGKDHVYFFTFNLAGDPMESVDELDEYVQMVKRETGHDKVNFLAVSLGGTIFTAYAEKYAYKNDVACVVNAVACLNGTNIMADFFKREWNLSDEFIYSEYFPMIMEESNDSPMLGYVANIAIRILPKQVLMDCLTGFYDSLYYNMLTRIPQFWAMLPKEEYPALADKLLAGDDYAVLRAKTDAFQTARMNLSKNMLRMQENGTRIHNICGYNLYVGDVQYSFFKIINTAQSSNGDAIIPIESTSVGATAALPNCKLENADTSSKYVSPDGSIDASTCTLPDSTWFFKDMHHENANNNAATMNLVRDLLTDKNFTDINYAPEKYPQFNFGTNNKPLRRWLLPDAKAVDQSKLSQEDRDELNAAIKQAEDVMDATIGNQADVDAATERLENILIKINVREPKKKDPYMPVLEKLTKLASDTVYRTVGPKGYSDR
ncbi:MAG: alpha/beta fold hydrolase [Clostridiales bacterium]|nr:alpha/beta fold hydrolase [Clostridiales bacterium]